MPLLLAMRFPPLGRSRDLHPLEHDHAVRTENGRAHMMGPAVLVHKSVKALLIVF